ncbi:MAG TPA: DUF2330 domain-containing protein, partial [Fimbriimonadaceae bacterium]|nr:DUF2330 domain-containing protein [Fimbriimonadaceae bacterium]
MGKILGGVLSAVGALTASSAMPCASVFNASAMAYLQSERVAIIWEPQSGTEHFIREAEFRGTGGHFGFLVPTPTKPSLAEAKSAGLARLWRHRPSNVFPEPKAELGAGFGGGGGRGAIQIVKQEQVSGYDATVLTGGNGQLLLEWLAANQYQPRHSVAQWSNSYMERDWFMTAFKIAKTTESEGVQTQPVRITFGASRPFYPYREPDEPRPRNGVQRRLILYVVAPFWVQGRLEKGFQVWNAKSYRVTVPESERRALVQELNLDDKAIPSPIRMTMFIDETDRRPPSDLYFEALR